MKARDTMSQRSTQNKKMNYLIVNNITIVILTMDKSRCHVYVNILVKIIVVNRDGQVLTALLKKTKATYLTCITSTMDVCLADWDNGNREKLLEYHAKKTLRQIFNWYVLEAIVLSDNTVVIETDDTNDIVCAYSINTKFQSKLSNLAYVDIFGIENYAENNGLSISLPLAQALKSFGQIGSA